MTRSKLRTQFTITAAVALALVSLACGSSKPPSFDLAAYQSDSQAMVEQYTSIERGNGFKDVSRVVIPSFQVEYIVTSSASAGSYSMGSRNTSRVSVMYELDGLDDDRVQSITDALYGEFVQDLEAQGIEVVSKDDLLANPAWAGLAGRGVPTPVRGKSRTEPKAGESIVSAPTGMAVYYTQDDPKIGLVGAFKNVGAINKGENAATFEGKLMEAFDADLVRARFVIGFAQIATEGGMSKQSSVSADFRFAVAPGSTQIKVIRDFKKHKAPFSSNYVYQLTVNKAARTFLKQPLFSPAPFVESIEDTTELGTRVGTAVANTLSVLGALAGGGGGISTQSVKKYTITVNPDQYQNSAEQYVGAVLSMFDDRIGEVR